MNKLELKKKVEEVISELSDDKLQSVIDFAVYLRNKEHSEELFKTQVMSKAYQEWLDPQEDIYDEIFSDEIK